MLIESMSHLNRATRASNGIPSRLCSVWVPIQKECDMKFPPSGGSTPTAPKTRFDLCVFSCSCHFLWVVLPKTKSTGRWCSHLSNISGAEDVSLVFRYATSWSGTATRRFHIMQRLNSLRPCKNTLFDLQRKYRTFPQSIKLERKDDQRTVLHDPKLDCCHS